MRAFLKKLLDAQQIQVISEPTDVRELQGKLFSTHGPAYFEHIRGYQDYSVVGGVFTSREMVANVLGCPPEKLAQGFQAVAAKSLPPVSADAAPVKEVIVTEDQLDLSALPIPLMHVGDGGPYIAGGVVVADDPRGELGTNLGMYRLMYRTKNETGIDLVTASDLRTYYQRALELGRPLPVSVVIGASPACMLAATYKAPFGVSEYEIAGAMEGSPIRVVKSETNNIMVPADAELILEGEILPIGWTEHEGPFGEFAGFQGESKWNPLVRFHCLTRRRKPIYYSLLMPDENDWLLAASTEKTVYSALRGAGLDVKAVCATAAGACFWNVVASIHKRTGEGKNAVLAALSVGCIKYAVITDDDVNIFNPCEVERAITFRTRPAQDVIIVTGARGNHVDPTLEAWTLPKGSLPTTSKLGIDATKPDSIPWERYQKIQCYSSKADKNLTTPTTQETIREICKRMGGDSLCFSQIVDSLTTIEYPAILKAWGEMRALNMLKRNPDGTYFLQSV